MGRIVQVNIYITIGQTGGVIQGGHPGVSSRRGSSHVNKKHRLYFVFILGHMSHITSHIYLLKRIA